MKTKLFQFVLFNLFLCLPTGSLLFSQSINGKLGTGGQFIIRDTSSNFMTLSQSTGNATFFKNVDCADSNSTSLTGVFTKNGKRFIHNYRVPGTDGMNTFIGINAGSLTMNGTAINESSSNTAVGYVSLGALTTGYYNSAFGVASLFSNTTGYLNSAFGVSSLRNNTTGSENSAFGIGSLINNTSGIKNSAFGRGSMLTNTTGGSNSAFGINSLYSNTTGVGNSAFGFQSLILHTTGSNNTGVGFNAGSNITTGSNNTAIGYNSQVPNESGSNQVRLGNEFITYAGVQVAWTITSDRRWKSAITNSNLGLDFISKLNPVSYFRTNDEKQKTEYGFIAQDVEEVLKESGAENSGMITIDDAGKYELRYNDLLAPMVKAIQQLKEENENLKSENDALKQMFVKFQETQARIVKEVEKLETNDNNVKEIKLGEK